MIALAFLNPLFLWALPLCAVPIIIHLLNRRRFKKVPWAAIEFLLAAMRRNRKRLRMEQWLVLLLRTLAVLFLVLLVTRPQLSGGALLGSRTHHVVLLDDSASMGQRMGSTHLFDRAQDRVRVLADRLGETRGGDLFSVLRTSRPTAPDLWQQRVGPDLGKRVGALLKQFPLGDGTMNLGAVLAEARRRAVAVPEASRTRYYLASDLRAWDWLTEDYKARPALLAELLAMPMDREHVEVLAVGGNDSQNLAVAAVRRLDRLAVAGVPTTLAVDVINHGLDPSQPTEVAVEVDGRSRVLRPVEGLAPGQRVSIPVVHTFHGAGFHRILASLPASDRFPTDDRHTLALAVKDRSRVLLVDGEPGGSIEEGETYFLATALDPGGEARSGIEPQVIHELALGEQELGQFDVVYLCNVPCPVEPVARKLEDYVAAGGGLVVFAGGQVDPTRYAEVLYRDGRGVLPLAYGELAGDPDRPERMFLAKRDHPVVVRFPELVEMLMARAVLVKRFLGMVENASDTAAVIARLRDGEGPALIAARTFGTGGEVFQFGITADAHWSTWPKTDINVVVLREVHFAAAREQDLSSANLGTDGHYRLTLDPGLYKPDVTVRSVAEDGSIQTFTAEAPAPPAAAPGTAPPPSPASPQLVLDIAMTDLRDLGAYEVDLHLHGDRVEQRVFARNPPPEESRLVRLASSAWQRAYPPEAQERVSIQEEGAGRGSGTGEGELWYILAAALLVGLLAESLLAWRFGRR